MPPGVIDVSGRRAEPVAALAFFSLWTVATWVFEGRIETLLRPDAVADRALYALGVNLLLGVAGGLALLWRWCARGGVEPSDSGFPAIRRTLMAILAGLVLGFAAYVGQGAPTLDPTVILNAFSQVLVVSAAEIVVCWAVVGTALRRAARPLGPNAATMVAGIGASILFGLYHFAHSAPFNTVAMAALLSVVGLATSAFFFVSRDIAGTIVFHNVLGTFGVIRALASAGALGPLESPQPPLAGTAILTAAVVAGGYALIRGCARHRVART